MIKFSFRALVLSIALASPVAAQGEGRFAVPLNAAEWITDADYTTAAIGLDHEGTVAFSLVVAPDGSVQSCEITDGTAPEGLKALTCRLIEERARFRPAQSADGVASVGTFRGVVRWDIPDGPIGDSPLPHLSFPIALGPSAPAPQPGELELEITVAADGTVNDCSWRTTTGHFEYTIPREYLDEMCSYFMFAPYSDNTTEPRTFRLRTTVEEIVEE